MSFWIKLKDWLLGFEYIDKEAFDVKMDALKVDFGKMVDDVKTGIDADKDGMVSVGETYRLIKASFKMFLKMIKSWY